MKKFNIKTYLRVLVAIIASLLITQFLIREVFLGYSPKIRPDLANNLIEKTLALFNKDTYVTFVENLKKKDSAKDTQINQSAALKELDSKPYVPTIIKGVYAKESTHAVLFEARINEVDWVSVPYTKKDGSIVMINIPVGTQPPSPGLF